MYPLPLSFLFSLYIFFFLSFFFLIYLLHSSRSLSNYSSYMQGLLQYNHLCWLHIGELHPHSFVLSSPTSLLHIPPSSIFLTSFHLFLCCLYPFSSFIFLMLLISLLTECNRLAGLSSVAVVDQNQVTISLSSSSSIFIQFFLALYIFIIFFSTSLYVKSQLFSSCYLGTMWNLIGHYLFGIPIGVSLAFATNLKMYPYSSPLLILSLSSSLPPSFSPPSSSLSPSPPSPPSPPSLPLSP